MKKMEEVRRRSMFYEDEAEAFGPYSTISADAEIVVDTDDGRVYCHAHWDNEDDYRIHCGAYQESVYDEYEKINHAAFGDRDGRFNLEYILSEECIEDDSVFDPIYEELEKMIHRELEAHEAIELLEG